MNLASDLLMGLSTALTPVNLFYCFAGVFLGTLIGVLPGIGPPGAIAMLLPVTFHATPVSATILIAGIYYGAMYGGSTTSILVNIPGEAASVITCIDGYQMARKGRAGPALGIAAFGSFIAGTISLVLLMCLMPVLAKLALSIGPPEYFALICLGMVILAVLIRGSVLRAMLMIFLGLLLSYVGMDMVTGKMRFTHGVLQLASGIDLVPMVMGLFGISELLVNFEEGEDHSLLTTKIKNLLPTLQDWKDSFWPIIRGSILGFFIGIMPGPGSTISAFTSYGIEKKLSRHPEKFGTGMIQGVAGPESANNAAASGTFVPLFTLGLPSHPVMALLMGALMVHGLTPGPLLMIEHKEIFWGTVGSMYIGNVMLLVLNLPLIGLWVRVLSVPRYLLLPLIFLFCLIGAYSLNSSLFDVGVMLFFGILGYLCHRFNFETAPFIMAFVLGPMFEKSLRQTLISTRGSFRIFVQSPIALFALITLAVLLTWSVVRFFLYRGVAEESKISWDG
jgi:putative tricarboxylic transport membrane protein